MSRRLTATVLSVLLIVYSSTAFGIANAKRVDGTDLSQPSAKTEAALAHLSSSFEALSQRIGPAVVQVFTIGYRPVRGGANSGQLSKRRSGGSGVILDPEGYIITNAAWWERYRSAIGIHRQDKVKPRSGSTLSIDWARRART